MVLPDGPDGPDRADSGLRASPVLIFECSKPRGAMCAPPAFLQVHYGLPKPAITGQGEDVLQ